MCINTVYKQVYVKVLISQIKTNRKKQKTLDTAVDKHMSQCFVERYSEIRCILPDIYWNYHQVRSDI